MTPLSSAELMLIAIYSVGGGYLFFLLAIVIADIVEVIRSEWKD